ncbi:MAG TPA: BON domain-containing protein [Thiobacillus sp.]|nr:BON domain-containing protein [Thiobacillus sp.]
MKNGSPILKTVWAALEREPHINLHRWPVQLDLTGDNALVVEGEVESVAAKKRVLEIAGAAPGVRGVVDRLHVVPSEYKGDGEILDGLKALLLDVRELNNCTLRVMKKGQAITLREAGGEDASGDILAAVKDGVVTLDGWAISLSHKRLAGVLAWWVPGCRDVVDGLEVSPPEQDNDDEVSDALSLVLEMDPMIPHPEQIRIHTDNYVVTLEGLVATQTEKDRAEQDAWCLFAVDKVINNLAVGR